MLGRGLCVDDTRQPKNLSDSRELLLLTVVTAAGQWRVNVWLVRLEVAARECVQVSFRPCIVLLLSQ